MRMGLQRGRTRADPTGWARVLILSRVAVRAVLVSRRIGTSGSEREADHGWGTVPGAGAGVMTVEGLGVTETG